MRFTWTNHDRTALAEWLSTDLGQKFLRWLEQEKPPMPETTDLTSFALFGAITKGYTMLLERITSAAKINMPPLPPQKFIDTSDNPKEPQELAKED